MRAETAAGLIWNNSDEITGRARLERSAGPDSLYDSARPQLRQTLVWLAM